MANDYTNKQVIYAKIKECGDDGKALYGLCNDLRNLIVAGAKAEAVAEKAVAKSEKRIAELEKALEAAESTEERDMSDDVLMVKLRELLFVKLEDKTLSAAEIRELKELFGLTQKQADLIINVIDYANAEV